MSDAPPSLRLEAGECLTLSPASDRFKSAYRQTQPRRAEEVRATLGLSDEANKALQAQGRCCQGTTPAFSPLPEDLTAEDPEIRNAARRAAYAGLQAYVQSPTPGASAYLAPVFERYLEISKAILNIITLSDIEVADGATLTISASTNVVYANKVIIHGSGRIVCIGSTKFKIASLEGTRRFRVIGVGGIGAVGTVLGH